MTHHFEILCNNSSEFILYSSCLGRAETKDKDSDIDIIYALIYSPEANTFALAEKNRIMPQMAVLWSPNFSDTFCTPHYIYS